MKASISKIISCHANVVSQKVLANIDQFGFICTLRIKLNEMGLHKIFHPLDNENVLGVDNLEKYLNNLEQILLL